MIAATTARQRLELAVLERMVSIYAPFGVEETYYPLQCFGVLDLDRELVRALLRGLTDRGFCKFQRGLWREDGTPGGAGYGITRRGRKYRAALEELLA